MIAFLLGGGGCVSGSSFTRRLGAHSLFLAAVACLIAAVLTAPALAATETTFTVSVVVTQSCTISTTPASAARTPSGTYAITAGLAVSCGKGASTVSVGLSSARSAASLYQDAAHSIPWDAQSHLKALRPAVTHAAQPVQIYGEIAPQDASDSAITATIDY